MPLEIPIQPTSPSAGRRVKGDVSLSKSSSGRPRNVARDGPLAPRRPDGRPLAPAVSPARTLASHCSDLAGIGFARLSRLGISTLKRLKRERA